MGCGEAKMSASSTARTSRGGRTASVASAVVSSVGGAGAAFSSLSAIPFLRWTSGLRRRGPALFRAHGAEDADRAEEAALVDLHVLQPDELEQGEEGHDH